MSSSSTITVEIDALPPCVIYPARKEHKATVFFLHGLGDTAEHLGPSLAEIWENPVLDHVKLVMPTAPIAAVTGNNGFVMSTWFDVYSFDILNRKEDEPGLYRAASKLNGLIKYEQETHGIPYSRIIIGGISQGAAVSLLTALTTLHPIGGLFVLSSYIPLRKKILDILSPRAKELSIFWGHGNIDLQVDHDTWKELAKELARDIGIPFIHHASDQTRLAYEDIRDSGINALRFHTYKWLGHWFNEEETDDLVTWISFALSNSV